MFISPTQRMGSRAFSSSVTPAASIMRGSMVSIGTTLPKVMVSTMSAVSGHGEIAYGNAIGSVICNSALVTAITSLVKGCSDLSLGNIVGANVFNLVLVSGVSVTLAPFTVPQSSTLFGINSSLVLEIPVMLAVMMIVTLPALKRGKLSRAQGVILLCIYAAFCAIQFTM